MFKLLFIFSIFLQFGSSANCSANKLYDPTKPLTFSNQLGSGENGELQDQKLIVYSIIKRFGKSSALVNDQFVYAGDYVNTAKVLRITSNKVIFLKNGEQFSITLYDANVKSQTRPVGGK